MTLFAIRYVATAAFITLILANLSYGAEFIPLEFDNARNLSTFQLSEGGDVVIGAEYLADRKQHAWTSESGAIDLSRALSLELLVPDGLLGGSSHDGHAFFGNGPTNGVENDVFRWSVEDGQSLIDGRADLIWPEEGFDIAAAHDISADGGTVVGSALALPDERFRAFSWTEQEGVTWLEAPPNLRVNGSVRLSANGQFAVASLIDIGDLEVNDDTTAFLVRWSLASPNRPEILGPLNVPDIPPPHIIGSPRAISENGRVVVGRGYHDSLLGDGEIFRWTEGGQLLGLGIEGGATAISADGRVMIGSESSTRRAFVWTPEDGVSFFSDTSFKDINAAGTVVVGGERSGHAIVWDSTNGKRRIRDLLIDEYGLGDALDGWELTDATQISADGLTIAGTGVAPSGDDTRDYWLVSLDEPLVAGLLGDYDMDGKLTSNDIDQLSSAILMSSVDSKFDVNADDSVDLQDHASWIAELAHSLPGDTNLDGTVEFADFLSLSTGFGKDGGWADGDFNASLTVDFADFLLLSANFGNSNELAATVPEPDAMWLGLFLLLTLILSDRRRRTLA